MSKMLNSTKMGEKEDSVSDYRNSHTAPEKGESYHKAFTNVPYRNMVWELEQDILDHILKTYFHVNQINHLDFACGTGRILSHYADRASSSVGVDISPSMLEIARKHNQRSELFLADLTRDDVLNERKFNLITAFRFFLNAESELRMEVMKVLANHLGEDGYLVFNVHNNTNSLSNRLRKMLGRSLGRSLSLSDIETLLAGQNLEIEEIFHLCVLPSNEYHMIIPRTILFHFERVLSKFSVLKSLGQNLIFICKHTGR
jgi:predicted TPR repeat methyltransferase